MKSWYAFGEEHSGETVDASVISSLVERGRGLRDSLQAVPVIKVIEVLHEAGRRLADPGHPARKEALEKLPPLIHFSGEMVEAGLATLCDILQRDNLGTQLLCDLEGPPELLDSFQWHEGFHGYMKAVPRGLLAHVSAGNVFVGAADSLVRGILTKNVNLLKMSAADPYFPLLFARLLAECDPGGSVAGTIACVPFRGGDQEVENVVKNRSDAIMVYGGADAVMAYRQGLGIHTKLIEYGPKYSCVFLEAKELAQNDLTEIARLVARDFTMWDQSACSSPHVVFVDDDEAAHRFAHALGAQLEEWARKIPHGEIPFQEKVEVTRSRELARVEEALGQGELIIPAISRQDWTVVFDRAPRFRVSPHHRTAYVKPVANIAQIAEILGEHGPFVQSVGVLASPATRFAVAEKLTSIGADRVTELGWMTRRKHGSPHDGTRGLGELVRWVSMGHRTPFVDPFDYREDAHREQMTLLRLNRLVSIAREKSPFHAARLPERPLDSLAAVRLIPVMTQQELRENLPPAGTGILTAPLINAYAFSSSGTTGTPKSVYRTVPETLHNARALAKGLFLSLLSPGDKVANLLFPGHMWASFVSYNQTFERCGVLILPIGGHLPFDVIAGYLRTYQPNVAISLPTVILSLARWVEENGATGITIEKLITGGEHLFPEGKAYISKVLGTKRFASTGYTSNDTGAIAFQCEQCKGGVHHVHEDLVHVELVDAETGEPVPDGQPGKVLVTNLHRTLMPMLRYDVGDLARFLPERCSCGRTLRLLELLGRSDETLRVGTNLVQLEGVARAVGNVEGLSQQFRMVVSRSGVLEKLSIEVEAFGELDPDRGKSLEKALLESLSHEMDDVVREMSLPDVGVMELSILPAGTLPRNPRTGKIRQVVDEREYGARS